ncbi:hypothetical protein AVP3_0048 [Aeromonas phage AVP3]
MRTEREIRNERHRLVVEITRTDPWPSRARLEVADTEGKISGLSFALGLSSEFLKGERAAHIMIRRCGMEYAETFIKAQEDDDYMRGFLAVVEDFHVAKAEAAQ